MTIEDMRLHTKENARGCWIWQRAKQTCGYGYASPINGQRLAHRIMWTLVYGPVPTGLRVMHICDTPACINPEHLKLGTDLDNIRDAVAKGRMVHGPAKPNAKLTESQAKAILGMRPDRSTSLAHSLSKKYSISTSVIWSIWHRRSWRYLTA